MNGTAEYREPGHSHLAFSMGNALLRMANHYPTLMEVVLEQVQNAIDSEATRIGIVLNKKKRILSVSDNGHGASRDKFDEALRSVGSSIKAQDKLGQFGMGLIAPLGKCDVFTFTSCPKEAGGEYREWLFSTADIKQQTATVQIPCRVLPGYTYNPDAISATEPSEEREVKWRTKVTVRNYTADPVLSRIDSADTLIEEVLRRFSNSMRKLEIRLNIRFTDEKGAVTIREDVTASQFSGQPLEEVFIDNSDSGMTTFRLYLARRVAGGRKPSVVIGEAKNDFRFPASGLVNVARKWLSAEVGQALLSGVFEGEILSTYSELDANRRCFERNSSMYGFCKTIEEWYERYGREYMENAKEESKDNRYNNLGQRSLESLKKLLSLPAFDNLRAAMSTFERGSAPDGVEKPAPPQTDGIEQEAFVPAPETGSAGIPDNEQAAPPPAPDPGVYTFSGPRKRRTLVKHAGVGLRFSHMVMEGSDRLYELDVREGVLNFNIRHPSWVACEENDRSVMQLQEFVAIQALTQLALPDEWKLVAQRTFDEQIAPIAFLLTESSSFSFKYRKDEQSS